MPNRSGQYTSGRFSPATVSFNLEATQYVPYCVSPLPSRMDSPLSSQQNSPQSHCDSPSFPPFAHAQCPKSLPMEVESPPVFQQNSQAAVRSPPGFRRLVSNSVAYEMDVGNSGQYCLSPITVEMEKFFSYPTMSVTFMPCVCVPDYPVEEGKPRKICRRCSVTPTGNR